MVDGILTPCNVARSRKPRVRHETRSSVHTVIYVCWLPMYHAGESLNSLSITKIGRRVPHNTCYITHEFQGQKVKGQGHRPTSTDTKCAISSER